MKHKFFFLPLSLLLTCCNPGTQEDPTPTPADIDAFAKGADISWVTEQEQDGVKFYNAAGTETDCFKLMREIGMNAVRLRVWLNPVYGLCDKADVMTKAERAYKEGLNVMIDFHYSDWFADPSRQDKPAAWENYTLSELQEAITLHTTDVLEALKEKNITPYWIQIGNETTNGMMFQTGYLWKEEGDDWTTYVALSNAGYNAAKAIFPDSKIIVHIDNAFDYDKNKWWYQTFINAGGKVDVIGLSHYPQTSTTYTWQEMNARCITDIQTLHNTFHKDVMICEVGTKSNNLSLAQQVMTDLMDSLKTIEGCSGIFYWEPQVYNGWKPNSYNTLGWGAYDMGAFTNAGRPAPVLDAFKD